MKINLNEKIKKIIMLIIEIIVFVLLIFLVPVNMFKTIFNINNNVDNINVCIGNFCEIGGILKIIYNFIAIILCTMSIIYVFVMIFVLFKEYIIPLFKKFINLEENKVIAAFIKTVEIISYLSMSLILLLVIYILALGLQFNDVDIVPKLVTILIGNGLIMFSTFTSFSEYIFHNKKEELSVLILGIIITIIGMFYI